MAFARFDKTLRSSSNPPYNPYKRNRALASNFQRDGQTRLSPIGVICSTQRPSAGRPLASDKANINHGARLPRRDAIKSRRGLRWKGEAEETSILIHIQISSDISTACSSKIPANGTPDRPRLTETKSEMKNHNTPSQYSITHTSHTRITKTSGVQTPSTSLNVQSHPTTVSPPSLPVTPAAALRSSKSFDARRGRGSTAPLTAIRSAALRNKNRRPVNSSSSNPFTNTYRAVATDWKGTFQRLGEIRPAAPAVRGSHDTVFGVLLKYLRYLNCFDQLTICSPIALSNDLRIVHLYSIMQMRLRNKLYDVHELQELRRMLDTFPRRITRETGHKHSRKCAPQLRSVEHMALRVPP